RRAMPHLEPTAREALSEATRWATANDAVIRLVRDSPRAIEEDAYRLRPARGWLSRGAAAGLGLLGLGAGRRKPDALEMDEDELARELSRSAASGRSRPALNEAKAARLSRARAIVDEALTEE